MFLAVGDPPERDQAIGGDAGGGLGEDAVDHRVDGGVAADDESDEHDRGRAQCRRAPQDADADVQVCGQLLGSLADQSRKYAYDVTIKEIIVSGDLAAVRLVWTLTVRRPGQVGGTATTEPGLDLFRRQGDGTWKIVRYLAYEE